MEEDQQIQIAATQEIFQMVRAIFFYSSFVLDVATSKQVIFHLHLHLYPDTNHN